MKIIHQRYQYPFIDIGIGQSHLSRNSFGAFIGGTPVNSHELSVTSLYFALNNIVLPDITAQHPNWSYEDRREEAIRRIELRSADNLRKGYLPELDREAVITTEWEVVEKESGKKMATWNGDKYTTREELWNNFEQYARFRSEWNDALEREKTAQQEMENAVVHGDAKGAATWLSHESNLARYFQVWEKESDGRIVSRQYDVGLIVGRDITQQEAGHVMNNLSKLYGEKMTSETAAYPHVISKEAIHIRDVSLAERQEVVFSQKFQASHRDNEMNHLKKESGVHASTIIAQETHRADGLVYPQRTSSNFVGDIGGRVINNTRETVQQVFKLFTDEQKLQNTKGRVLGLPVVRGMRSLLSRDGVKEHRSEKPTERLTLEKIREKPMRIGEIVRKRQKEMRQTITALAIAVDTRVGIAAIPLLIGALAKELPQSVKAVEKSIGRHERRKRRVKHSELRIMGKRKEKKMFSGRRVFDRRSGEVVRTQSKIEKRSHNFQERRVRKTSEMKRATEIRKLKPKKRKRIQLAELARRKERMVGVTRKKEREKGPPEGSVQRIDIVLHKTLVRLARKITYMEGQRKKKDRKRSKEKFFLHVFEAVRQQKNEKIILDKKETRREIVTRYSFAWVLWLLQESNSIRSMFDPSNNKNLQQTEKLLQTEPRQWILLSIIWYLSMIREQKAYSIQHTAYRKKKKSKFKSNNLTLTGLHLPNQAIIFAYGS